MFRKPINSTALTTDIADAYFTNIVGDTHDVDVSFVATLRALVGPRIGEDEKVVLTIPVYECGTNHEADMDYIASVCYANDPEAHGEITLFDLYGASQEDRHEALMEIARKFSYDGWEKVDKVTLFYRKTFEVYCFINVERKCVAVFTEGLDYKRLHYLQVSIPAFLPWYFGQGEGFSDIEMELIQSLRKKESDDYERIIMEIAKQYNFREARIRRDLEGFEARQYKVNLRIEERKLQEIRERIQVQMEHLQQYLAQRDYEEAVIRGWDQKIAESEDNPEIMDYFLRNKKLSLIDVDDQSIRFIVSDYITYFDEEMGKQMFDNPRSVFYRPDGKACNNYIKAEDMKKLLYALFVDQTLKMKVCAAYRITLGGGVDALIGYNYGGEFLDCLPNPHTDRYGCMGNYTRYVMEMLERHDYVGAIEQCVSSCKSLNFGDSTVMKEFAKRMYGFSGSNVNTRCIELPDGSIVTPTDAVAWLNKQEGEDDCG